MDVRERFLSKIELMPSGCWHWKAGTMPRGYGLFSFKGSCCLAHRISHLLFKGTLDDELDVMHSCDNPKCVNPDHLSQGTRMDNMQDCKRKGRNTPGEKHGRSKLTEDQAKAVKAMPGFQKDIAKHFGISQAQVSEIKRGTKWAHLN